MKKFMAYCCFLGALAVMSAAVVERTMAAAPFSYTMLPAGTRMAVPPRVLKEYQTVATSWGRIFNYLYHEYSITSHSTKREGQYTSYIPLVIEDGERTDLVGEIVMMDILDLLRDKRDDTLYLTTNDTFILNIKTGDKRNLISVSDLSLGKYLFVDGQFVLSWLSPDPAPFLRLLAAPNR